MHLYLSHHDVLPVDGDPVVPVWSRVLVPEANDVTQLMHHDAKLVAILPYRDGLRTRARFTKGFQTTSLLPPT